MKSNWGLLPGVRLDSLTLTPYSTRLIQVEGVVRVGRGTLKVGTLLKRSQWAAELRTFLSEIPSAHDSWNREIAARRQNRRR